MTFFFDPLPMFGFDLIAIDPPTDFALYSQKGNKKSASAQYDIMSWEELAAMPVGHLARCNAVVALWACPPTLKKSFALLDAWGAEFKTEMVWNKVTRKGKRRMGTGYRARGFHESILIGVFGNEYQNHKAFDGAFEGVARGHSQKPKEFYRMMKDRTPNAYRCDIFSRETHDGFVGWGREVRKFDNGPVPVAPKIAPIASAPLFDMLESAA